MLKSSTSPNQRFSPGFPGLSKYSPFSSFELSKRRQEFIIDRMVEEKFISASEGERAIKKSLS
jgi:membrane carboxypeptidase/penicillin-binding protein